MVAPRVAEMVAATWLVSAVVRTVNVTDACPAGIVTLAGTVADVWLLASWMTAPPEGAGPVRVTVPVEDVPPITDAGLSVSDNSAGGEMVSGAESVMPSVALMVATV